MYMWKSEKGMALGMAIFFMAAAGAGSYFVIKTSLQLDIPNGKKIRN